MDRESDAAKEEKKASAPRETGIVCAYKQGEKYGFIKRFDFRSRMHLDKDMVRCKSSQRYRGRSQK